MVRLISLSGSLLEHFAFFQNRKMLYFFVLSHFLNRKLVQLFWKMLRANIGRCASEAPDIS
ncbi:hypothetical protein DYH55_12555 [Methylovirgula sp. 4M-Z18]|nr:hypothetical protein DYH55_12555 [Methylovirgula sp. 4M-Z18]